MPRRHARSESPTNTRIARNLACPACQRPLEECFCARIERLTLRRTEVLILQHPREQYKLAASARLAQLSLSPCELRVGISWPNLSAALGHTAAPGEWGVLYLKGKPRGGRSVQVFDRRDRPLASPPALRGLVVLDGNWQQAKTLWWRNAWLLKLSRVTLDPAHPSLRQQVRESGVSTIEALALALEGLGEPAETATRLRERYAELVVRPYLARMARKPAPVTNA